MGNVYCTTDLLALRTIHWLRQPLDGLGDEVMRAFRVE